MKPETITCANPDHGLKTGDKLYINFEKKSWYKRLFHFITFRKFEEIYVIDKVTDACSFTIEK